jgi:hypothetical protein
MMVKKINLYIFYEKKDIIKIDLVAGSGIEPLTSGL